MTSRSRRGTVVGLALLWVSIYSTTASPDNPPTPPPPVQSLPQTAPADSDAGEPAITFETSPAGGLPAEYVDGRCYIGNFLNAWDIDRFQDPIESKVFLAAQDGATHESLQKVDAPDVDLALQDLVAGRLLRLSGGLYRPAFPLIHGEAGAAFSQAVKKSVDRTYPSILPLLKKVQKAAKKENLSPWLFTLLWSETLESPGLEQTLADAGALRRDRLRREGYLWIQIPGDPFMMGVDRYSSGNETLHYVWTVPAHPEPALQDFTFRQKILEGALTRLPWSDSNSEEFLQETGLLDAQKRVRIPILKKGSPLLAALRETAQHYARNLLATLKPAPLAQKLGVPADEAFAAAFATVGFRILEQAIRDGLVQRPDYLAEKSAPATGMIGALVLTQDEAPSALERANYLYDKQDFAGAVREADKFLQTHPGDSEATFRKGMAQMKLQSYGQALETFEKALSVRVQPDDMWRGIFLIRAGNVLDLLSRREDALTKYNEALKYANVAGTHDLARQWMEAIYME